MSARRVTSTGLVLSCALAVVLLSGVPAQAAITHEYLSRITQVPATGPHGEAVSSHGSLDGEGAMTVDSGELYIAEGFEESRLDKFNDSTGAFVSQFPQVPSPAYDLRQGLAVGHGTGETEVYDTGDDHGGSGPEGIVAVYGAAGALRDVWKGEDTPAKGFGCFECGGSGAGVAVDDSANPLTKGDVYVSVPEQGVVDVFEPKGGGGEKYITQLTGPEPELHPEVHFEGPNGVAVSEMNGDVLVIDGSTVDVFEPTVLETYTLVRRLTGAGTPNGLFRSVRSVAVDGGSGDIYVSAGTREDTNVVDQFNSEGGYLGHLTGTPSGAFQREGKVAVDPETGDVYVGNSNNKGFVAVFGPSVVVPDVTTDSESNLTPTGATLNGTVNPDSAGEATCRFEWGTSEEFGKVAPCEPEGVAEGGSPVPVHAALSLQPDTTYYYRLQATNRANGQTNPGEPREDQTFTTPGAGIQGEWVSDVSSTSATLDASIDPNDAPTAYYFQYGTSAAYGEEAPAVAIGSGKGYVEASPVHLTGLSPGTDYHYRVVAVSELEHGVFVENGPDHTFTTQPVGSELVLPDGRQWEMVSPPDKHGADLIAQGQAGAGGLTEAAGGGGVVTYLASAPTEAAPRGYANLVQVLSWRGPEGWETRDVSLPHGGATEAGGQEYQLFSEDLSHAAVYQEGPFPSPSSPALLSGEASEETPYLGTDYLNGDFDEQCLLSCYLPLVTGALGHADVPPGTVFGKQGGAKREGPHVSGATPDLSHVVLLSEVPLTEGGGRGLYEWSGGQQLQFIGEGTLAEGEFIGVEAGWHRGAISDDGSRVVFQGVSEGLEGLLMRDLTANRTVQLDAAEPECLGKGECAGGGGELQVASSDGSKVFFTDSNRLTKNAMEAGRRSLYECEVHEAAGALSCDLSDLTPSGGPGGVQGSVLGASEDGSWVSFVTETNALYVEHDGAAKLVATLSGEDSSDWEREGTVRVSPNGEWLAFISHASLTGYDNHDALSGAPDAEVYLYDAAAGRVLCASCNPTGARPVGGSRVPSWTTAAYQPRYLSDSGRVFFDSSDALAPQDVDGSEDVYEYEPAGFRNDEGRVQCTPESVTFSERSGGCMGLISSGTSAQNSTFLDASSSGGDVFFLTTAQLAPQDYDSSLDVYDAHECTSAVPCFPAAALAPPPCTNGDACKPAPTPQPSIFGAPASATFSGAGNVTPSQTPGGSGKSEPKGSKGRARKLAGALRACRKKRGRRRAVCERQAEKRYGRQVKRSAKGRK